MAMTPREAEVYEAATAFAREWTERVWQEWAMFGGAIERVEVLVVGWDANGSPVAEWMPSPPATRGERMRLWLRGGARAGEGGAAEGEDEAEGDAARVGAEGDGTGRAKAMMTLAWRET